MKFVNQRNFHTKGNPNGDYTLGVMTCDFDPFKCFILEDTHNSTKIAGTTRIPAGFRELGLRRENTPLTLKHRIAYAKHPDGLWFKENPGWYHIEILKVPNYTGIYFHSGIDDSHTLGCNLPNYAFDISKADNQGASSVKATNDFYALAYPLLWEGKKIFLETRDEVN